jgi:hypothetical protein
MVKQSYKDEIMNSNDALMKSDYNEQLEQQKTLDPGKVALIDDMAGKLSISPATKSFLALCGLDSLQNLRDRCDKDILRTELDLRRAIFVALSDSRRILAEKKFRNDLLIYESVLDKGLTREFTRQFNETLEELNHETEGFSNETDRALTTAESLARPELKEASVLRLKSNIQRFYGVVKSLEDNFTASLQRLKNKVTS